MHTRRTEANRGPQGAHSAWPFGLTASGPSTRPPRPLRRWSMLEPPGQVCGVENTRVGSGRAVPVSPGAALSHTSRGTGPPCCPAGLPWGGAAHVLAHVALGGGVEGGELHVAGVLGPHLRKHLLEGVEPAVRGVHVVLVHLPERSERSPDVPEGPGPTQAAADEDTGARGHPEARAPCCFLGRVGRPRRTLPRDTPALRGLGAVARLAPSSTSSAESPSTASPQTQRGGRQCTNQVTGTALGHAAAPSLLQKGRI